MNPDAERWFWSPDVIVWVQEFFGPVAELPFRTITLLADSTLILGVAMLLYWTRGRRIAFTALSASMLGALVVTIIKFATDVPRPDFVDVIPYETRTAPSFPSGHSMHGVAFWGTLASLGVVRVPIAIVIAIGVMISRIYLSVHYPIDVLVGAGIGALCVVTGYLIWTQLMPRVTDEQISTLIGAICVGGVIIIPVANEFPIGWELVGGLVGAGIGMILESRRIGYSPESTGLRSTLARTGIGLAGVVPLVILVLLVRATGDWPLLRMILAFPIGFWAMFGAPFVLNRIGYDDGPRGRNRWVSTRT
jgi:membrane-associated phospholipid phosphatase